MARLQYHTEPGTLVLTPHGRIARADVLVLQTAAARLIARHTAPTVIVDLSLTRASGLAAIDALVRLLLMANLHRCDVRVRHLPRELRQLLDLTGLLDTVPISEPCACRTCSADSAHPTPRTGMALDPVITLHQRTAKSS
jgi:anti-anti-sigma regulatory factor